MRITSKHLENILPDNLSGVCRVGICNPFYLERKKPVLCHVPMGYGGPRWSAKPSEVMPTVKSIIVLIHFTPIALDYSVEDIILSVAEILWNQVGIKTHVLDELGRPVKDNLVGSEDSYLKATSYDGGVKIILLKELAYYAGLGQYGRNALIINEHFGSDIKIQALFTEAELEYDKPIRPRAYPGCKDCRICVDSCPAKAIKSYRLRSRENYCTHLVGDEPTIRGRLPLRKNETWDKASPKQKVECRICQSFCPVNSEHYVKKSLVFAKRGRNNEVTILTTRC